MTQSTQRPQQQVEAPHPFDLDKSEFEKLLDKDLSFGRIEEAVSDAAEAQTKDHLRRAVYLARAQDHLRRELDALEWVIMPLMGTRMGFKIDKKLGRDPQGNVLYPYTWEVVKDCILEALLSGANLTGNEINIIAGNPYLTKEFFERKLNELCAGETPRLANFIESPSVPRVQGGSAIVTYNVVGAMDGKPFNFTRDIAVKVNEGQGPDAILGKAKRKMFKWLLETITRQSFGPDGDGEENGYTSPTTPAATASRTAEAARGIEQAARGSKQAPLPPEPPTNSPPSNAPAARRVIGRPKQQQEQPKQEAPAPEPEPQPEPEAAPQVEMTLEERAQANSEGDIKLLRSELAVASVNPRKKILLDAAKQQAGYEGLIADATDEQVRQMTFYYQFGILNESAAKKC